MNIKIERNHSYYIIFNIDKEIEIQEYLFSLDYGIGWGSYLGKEINTYYSDLRKQCRCKSSKYVGVFVIRKRELYWRGKLFTLEEAIEDSKKEVYHNCTIRNCTFQEEITLFTINTYICDKENNIFYLKEVQLLDNSEKVVLSLDIGDRIFRDFEEINKEFYIC